MSRRANSTKRLEKRAEREAKLPGGGAPRASRERRTPTQVKSGRFDNIPVTAVAIAFGIVVLIGVLIYAVVQANSDPSTGPVGWQKAMMDSDPKLPGTYVEPNPGADGRLCTDATCIPTMDDREHQGVGVTIPICTDEQMTAKNYTNPLCYNSNPPTSGPHSPTPMPFRVLENPAPKENLVHNMEHGGIVIWYNTDNADVIKQLEDVAKDNIDRRRFVVMSKYTGMEADTIAVTAWTRIDKFKSSEYNKKRVQDFIDEHEKRFNPEGF